jgi:hypothetical protein
MAHVSKVRTIPSRRRYSKLSTVSILDTPMQDDNQMCDDSAARSALLMGSQHSVVLLLSRDIKDAVQADALDS